MLQTMKKKHHSEINWVNPTPEDLVYLRSLSYEEHSELLKEVCDAAGAKGISKRSLDEILEAVEKKATQVA